MRTIQLEKVTLNVGAGKDQSKLEKGIKLIKNLTGIAPVKTFTQKRIPTWSLRPGLPIGCKLTIRGARANELLRKFLGAKENEVKDTQFDQDGNFSFGIHEYIDIPGAEYDPEIGIIGFEVCVTLKRPGFRIKYRRNQQKKIPKRHKISKEEAIQFVVKEFNVKIKKKGEEQ